MTRGGVQAPCSQMSDGVTCAGSRPTVTPKVSRVHKRIFLATRNHTKQLFFAVIVRETETASGHPIFVFASLSTACMASVVVGGLQSWHDAPVQNHFEHAVHESAKECCHGGMLALCSPCSRSRACNQHFQWVAPHTLRGSNFSPVHMCGHWRLPQESSHRQGQAHNDVMVMTTWALWTALPQATWNRQTG